MCSIFSKLGIVSNTRTILPTTTLSFVTATATTTTATTIARRRRKTLISIVTTTQSLQTKKLIATKLRTTKSIPIQSKIIIITKKSYTTLVPRTNFFPTNLQKNDTKQVPFVFYNLFKYFITTTSSSSLSFVSVVVADDWNCRTNNNNNNKNNKFLNNNNNDTTTNKMKMNSSNNQYKITKMICNNMKTIHWTMKEYNYWYYYYYLPLQQRFRVSSLTTTKKSFRIHPNSSLLQKIGKKNFSCCCNNNRSISSSSTNTNNNSNNNNSNNNNNNDNNNNNCPSSSSSSTKDQIKFTNNHQHSETILSIEEQDHEKIQQKETICTTTTTMTDNKDCEEMKYNDSKIRCTVINSNPISSTPPSPQSTLIVSSLSSMSRETSLLPFTIQAPTTNGIAGRTTNTTTATVEGDVTIPNDLTNTSHWNTTTLITNTHPASTTTTTTTTTATTSDMDHNTTNNNSSNGKKQSNIRGGDLRITIQRKKKKRAIRKLMGKSLQPPAGRLWVSPPISDDDENDDDDDYIDEDESYYHHYDNLPLDDDVSGRDDVMNTNHVRSAAKSEIDSDHPDALVDDYDSSSNSSNSLYNSFIPQVSVQGLLDGRRKQRVLVLCTGGTLCMAPDPTQGMALAPVQGALSQYMKNMNELYEDHMPDIVLHEYDPFHDSSDLGPADWVRVACDIRDNYLDFDGFVVLTGTDTMAYFATALSFLLENLGKPVVFTGSQIPLCEAHNDARRNLIMALIFAGGQTNSTMVAPINEVTIYFHDRLLRACRATKIHTHSLLAFDSPNQDPLATIGIQVHVNEHLLLPPPKGQLRVHTRLDTRILTLRLVPGFDDAMIREIIQHNEQHKLLQAMILQLYGTGNIPSVKESFIQLLSNAVHDKQILVVATTQCHSGSVALGQYAVGKALERAGVVSAYDMTVEAIACKIGYLFGRTDLTFQQISQIMGSVSLRGELTTTPTLVPTPTSSTTKNIHRNHKSNIRYTSSSSSPRVDL